MIEKEESKKIAETLVEIIKGYYQEKGVNLPSQYYQDMLDTSCEFADLLENPKIQDRETMEFLLSLCFAKLSMEQRREVLKDMKDLIK